MENAAVQDAHHHSNSDLTEGNTNLIHAVRNNIDQSEILELIGASADVNITDNERKTALFYAAQSDNESVVRALIDADAHVNITDNEGKTALFYAVQSNNTRMTRVLIEEGHSRTDRKDNYGRTPLFYAITKSRPLIDYLLEKKSSMYIKDKRNMNILSFFINHCISKSLDCLSPCSMDEIIDLIVQKGFRRNTVLETIMSVLFCKFPLLLHSGIEETTFSQIFEFAKTYATEAKDKSMIDEVLQMMKQTANNKQLCATLMPNILVLLIKLGADPTSADSDGNTALHYVSCLPFYGVSKDAIMDLLMKLEEVEVQFDATNHENETSLLFCLMLHDNSHQYEGNLWSTIKILTEVCAFLLNNGSNVEETTRKGDSVFHLTLKLFQHLLERDKNILLLNDAVILLQLFAKTGKRVVKKRDGILNSPLHLWSSLEPSQQYFNDVPDGRDVFSVFSKSILDTLLGGKAEVDSRNENEETPLHLCRTWIAVRLLIDAEANPTLLDSMGCTPLIVAAMNKTFLIKDDIFYPDVELHPKAFWKNALEKKLDPWMLNKSDESVLSILIESEASSLNLAKALLEVAYLKRSCLRSDDIAASILYALCKDSLAHAHWKKEYAEKVLESSKTLMCTMKRDILHLCCRNILEASKGLSVDQVKYSVHWAMVELLLLYKATVSKSCLDIAEKYRPLKQHLEKQRKTLNLSEWKPEKGSAKLHVSKLIAVSNFSNCVVSVHSVRYHQEGIGKGLFGCQVFAGFSNQKDGRELAIKRIKSEKKFNNEIKNLAKLGTSHNQIISYFHSFDKTTDGFWYIMLELMDENLHRYLVKIRKGEYTVSKEEKKNICKQLLIGVHHMHEAGIIHCQLNPTNILIKLQPKLCLKIAGFGRSCTIEGRTFPVVYDEHNKCDEKYIKYSESWLAPEVLNSPDSANHTIKSDMFSCFVVLYKILTDKHPYQRPNKCLPADIIETIKKDQMKTKWDRARISHCSESVHLLENVLVWDKDKESTAQQLFRYPFFWSNHKKIEFLKLVSAEKLHVEHPNTTRLRRITKTIIGNVNQWDMDYNGERKHMPIICAEMQGFKKKEGQWEYNTDNTSCNTLIHLLRLIRNAHVHMYDIGNKEVARLVGKYVFLDYFPNLVVELFKEVKCLEWEKNRPEFGKAMQD